MRWQILCDFDGTISPTDTTDTLLDAFAAPEWRTIDTEMTEGSFGSRVARERQTALARASQAEIDRHLDTVKLDPGFAAFVAETMRLGLPLTIVSDGYDYSIKRIFANHGIENLDILCNALAFEDDNRIGVTFPYADPDCAVEAGMCKCAAMGRLRNRKSVLIGNGYSDFCTAGAADFVFARDNLIQHCKEENIPFYGFESFADLTPLLVKITGDGSELMTLAQANNRSAL